MCLSFVLAAHSLQQLNKTRVRLCAGVRSEYNKGCSEEQPFAIPDNLILQLMPVTASPPGIRDRHGSPV